MSETVIGKLAKIMPIVTGQSERGPWSRQSFVVEVEESKKYTRTICCETNKADIFKTLEGLKEGDVVTATFSASSREYKGKWFSTVNAFSLDKVNGTSLL